MDKHSIACFFFIATQGLRIKKQEIAEMWAYEDIQFLRNCGLIEDLETTEGNQYLFLTHKGQKFKDIMEDVTKLYFLQ